MNRSHPTNIWSLPLEVLKSIFDFLPILDKKSSRSVCNKWRFTVDEFGWPESVVFRLKLRGSTLGVANQGFLKSYRAIEQVTVEQCDIRMSMLPHKERKFPAVQEVILEEFNSQATVVNFLKFGCKYANSLVLGYESLGKSRRYVISGILKRNQVAFDNLTKLTMKLAFSQYEGGQEKHHYKSCSTFLKHAKIPNLCEFVFSFWCGSGSKELELPFKRTLANFTAFLANHATSLRNLTIDVDLSDHLLNAPFDWSRLPQNFTLDSCTINAKGRFGTLQQLVLPMLITGCGLKNLKIECWLGKWDEYDESHGNIIKQVLAANASSLEEVDLVVPTFQLNWICPCKLLKSVSMLVTERALVVESNVNPEEYHFPRLTNVHITLKSPPSNPSPLTTTYYEMLLSRNATTIKTLTVHSCILEAIHHSGWRWLNDCINIEYLCLGGVDADFSTNMGAVFPRVKKFVINLCNMWRDPQDLTTANWIAHSLPNLKIINSTNGLSLRALQVLLSMEGLSVIKFTECRYCHVSARTLVDIQGYCNSEAMKNSIKLTTESIGYSSVIHCKVTRIIR